MGRTLGEVLSRPAPLDPPNIESVHKDIPIVVTPPKIEEIRLAIGQIKIGMAAGPDNIRSEALKSDKELTAKMLHILFGEIK
ncbi:unnamed protein product [Schistosoma mattheei]|uniref:Uncharacterized protein n=1 Tax=Schistosoma mattheei TaxID=31246 RepID=A0A183NYG5_9TREM|nr:unnamed protein product [Schistosoma mattheei]